ncbi:histidinol dehydrogenase [Geomicrobium sediminis]|uniref:Histidinol dehydrogenase n=1 Tax=Geomicrobium sediminis TaxID=1347788 RepID=A0ABS2P7G5_9BACL|nr:histidinol dehydrogenase [Geomicrobium sediminis]
MRIERVKGELKSLRRSVEMIDPSVQSSVKEILSDVKQRGDEAVSQYTKTFDGADLSSFFVTEEEKQAAYEHVNKDVLRAIRQAAENIREYHARQLEQTWMMTKDDGTILGQKITPLDSVGVYVPGGTAVYPSTILMNVIPAQVAKVERIVMVSPPNAEGKLHPAVLVTAHELGVKDIYKAGGAQAVAALAYGTKTLEPVDKIVGPGNVFVAAAKREVFGHVDIDMIAGPSEIVVLCDDSANPSYVAADLLSQAEHDERASAIAVTTSNALAENIRDEVERQLQQLPREAIARRSIESYGAVYVAETLAEAVEVVNQLAPEHLEVMTKDPYLLLGKIKHAGAIFLGEYSAESVGDYFAGTNHVLPTNGTARFSSPLNVSDFTKKSSIISYSKQALDQNGPLIASFAREEGLEAHARAVEIRTKEGEV